MPKSKSFEMAGVNVTLHPHSPEKKGPAGLAAHRAAKNRVGIDRINGHRDAVPSS